MKSKLLVLGLLCALLVSLLFQMCIPKSEPEAIKYSYKDKIITKEQEKILEDTYTKFNYSLINEKRDPKLPDSREYWYSLETLESYIEFVKSEAKAKGYENMGIKIKMGQYPKEGKFDDRVPAKYNGYQTIYFVPTGQIKVGTVQIQSSGTGSTGTEAMPTDKEVEEIPGMDMGHLNPPK